MVPELHLVIVIFGTNLVSNISTKKSTLFIAHFLLLEISCKSNTHLGLYFQSLLSPVISMRLKLKRSHLTSHVRRIT